MEKQLRLSSNIIQKQTPGLSITPSLKQSLYILNLPIQELKDFLEQQSEENPLLDTLLEKKDTEKDPAEMILPDEKDIIKNLERHIKNPDIKINWKENQKENYRQNLITRPITLYDYLLRQLGILKLEPYEIELGEYIIENIDDNGYLAISSEEIVEAKKVKTKDVERLISIIQEFDPPGICARDVKECLMIQLKLKGEAGSLAGKITEKHLENLEKKKYKIIARDLGVSIDEVKNAVKEIVKLEPKPGRIFYAIKDLQNITPDIFLKEINNNYEIQLNNDGLPTLKINAKYRKLLKDKTTSLDVKNFLKQKLDSALWLINAVNQRQKSIYKITREIVRIQKHAIKKGLEHIKPLKLEDVAKVCNVSTSTVSRVVSNKYISTPNGCFRLKDFFSQNIESGENNHFSAQGLKFEIKNIIDKEDKKSPLSDKDITVKLQEKGIKIARRTIVKYREVLKIQPSHLRKE